MSKEAAERLEKLWKTQLAESSSESNPAGFVETLDEAYGGTEYTTNPPGTSCTDGSCCATGSSCNGPV